MYKYYFSLLGHVKLHAAEPGWTFSMAIFGTPTISSRRRQQKMKDIRVEVDASTTFLHPAALIFDFCGALLDEVSFLFAAVDTVFAI